MSHNAPKDIFFPYSFGSKFKYQILLQIEIIWQGKLLFWRLGKWIFQNWISQIFMMYAWSWIHIFRDEMCIFNVWVSSNCSKNGESSGVRGLYTSSKLSKMLSKKWHRLLYKFIALTVFKSNFIGLIQSRGWYELLAKQSPFFTPFTKFMRDSLKNIDREYKRCGVTCTETLCLLLGYSYWVPPL